MRTLLLSALLAVVCYTSFGQWTIASTPTTSIQGVVCLGSISNPGHLMTSDPLDYVLFNAPLGVGCTYSMRVPLTSTATAGEKAGFRIATGTLATVLGNLRIKTYVNSTLQETALGGNLLDIVVGNTDEIYFVTTKSFNAIVLEMVSTASALQQMKVYNILPGTFTVLPIRFLNLNIKAEGNKRQITWQQIADEPVQQVVLERSSDGQTFSRLAALSTDRAGTFTFTDASGGAVAWYRLRGATFSRKEYISAMVKSSLATSKAFTILSDAQQNIVLLNNDTPQQARVSVFNLQGGLLWQGTYTLQNRTTIPFPAAPSGLYRVSVMSDKAVQESLVRH